MRKHYWKLTCILLAMVLAAGCGNNSEFIRVNGTSLVTPEGEEFFIRGTNLGNWLNPEGYMFRFPKSTNSAYRINDGLCEMVGPGYVRDFWTTFVENYVTEKDIEYIASTGCNTLRIPFHYKMFTSDRYLCFEEPSDGYELMDKVVGWCRNHGLKVILDMHVCPAGQSGDNIDDSYGYPWLFVDQKAQDLFVDIWAGLAKHYKNDSTILGYDFMNEPIAHYFEDKEMLNANCVELYKRVCGVVSEIDPNHILIIGGVQWNGNFKPFNGVDFGENVMYTCHIYGCYPGKGSIGHFLKFRDSVNKPMFMGETGENTDQWVHDFRVAMEESGMGWTFWTYKKLDNEKGFLNIERPEGWDSIIEYLESDRSTYAGIREARKDQELYRNVLDAYLQNCLFENCKVNEGYISALGLKP